MREAIEERGESDSQNFGELANYLGNLEQNANENYKDILFYYIILNMQSYSLLNRLHTHHLEGIFECCLDDPEKRSIIIQKLRRYPLTSKPPGICFIFSMHEGRERGARVDSEKVQKYFEDELHYDIVPIIDPTVADVKNTAIELKAGRYMFYDRYAICKLMYSIIRIDKTDVRISIR